MCACDTISSYFSSVLTFVSACLAFSVVLDTTVTALTDLSIFMVYMYMYISVHCMCLLMSYLLVFVFATALIIDNVLRVLKGLQWSILCTVLQIPSSQKMKIEREFASEDQCRTAAVNFYLHNHPYASWRHIIRSLDWFGVPHKIHRCAEKLTGML